MKIVINDVLSKCAYLINEKKAQTLNTRCQISIRIKLIQYDCKKINEYSKAVRK